MKGRLRAVGLAAMVTLTIGCDGDPDDPTEPVPDPGPTTDAATDGPDTGPVDVEDELDIGPPPTLDVPATDDGAVDSGLPTTGTIPIDVTVTIDGAPSPETLVMQGGLDEHWFTDDLGQVVVDVNLDLNSEIVLMVSHPEARVRAVNVWPGETSAVVIELVRFDTGDNPDYVFAPPGEPEASPNTAYCGHCHLSLVEEWVGSVHRGAASNPAVQDLYAGAAAAFTTEVACLDAGGQWKEGLVPGTGAPGMRCFIGAGLLQIGAEGTFGGCADCHAPGIDGQLGGRDLLEATGDAYDYGVHCDVCHHVESIDESKPPGVGGWLQIVRPSEKSPAPALGDWLPLTFGPNPDSPNPRMGSVARPHFHEARLCAGCHEQHQASLVPGQALDAVRWPNGTLPIHTTYSEWLAGPFKDVAPCQSCHMPPKPEASNGADQQVLTDQPIGIATGWIREPGSIKEHTWSGPRHPESRMLQLAAAVFLKKAVAPGGALTATVTVRNVGPGHAIPTGEPLRMLLLTVDARCGDDSLVATGGDVVPDFGGALEGRDGDADWTLWPNAVAGERLRVVSQPGGWYDYSGYGPFGDGTFDVAAKGMPVEHFVGERTITAVGEDGLVTLTAPLPPGDRVYRVPAGPALPEADTPSAPRAGQPGFGFARVLKGPTGARMVPHFLAVDVVSDNRLLPQAAWTTTHTFDAAGCEDPVVQAVLVHRAWPVALATERGWKQSDAIMVSVSR